MKTFKTYLVEKLNEGCCGGNCEKEDEAQETIKDEKDFRDYAENKFKEVYKDKLDEEKMNEVIDGILDDNKELVEKGDWGSLVGILNKSFGH